MAVGGVQESQLNFIATAIQQASLAYAPTGQGQTLMTSRSLKDKAVKCESGDAIEIVIEEGRLDKPARVIVRDQGKKKIEVENPKLLDLKEMPKKVASALRLFTIIGTEICAGGSLVLHVSYPMYYRKIYGHAPSRKELQRFKDELWDEALTLMFVVLEFTETYGARTGDRRALHVIETPEENSPEQRLEIRVSPEFHAYCKGKTGNASPIRLLPLSALSYTQRDHLYARIGFKIMLQAQMNWDEKHECKLSLVKLIEFAGKAIMPVEDLAGHHFHFKSRILKPLARAFQWLIEKKVLLSVEVLINGKSCKDWFEQNKVTIENYRNVVFCFKFPYETAEIFDAVEVERKKKTAEAISEAKKKSDTTKKLNNLKKQLQESKERNAQLQKNNTELREKLIELQAGTI